MGDASTTLAKRIAVNVTVVKGDLLDQKVDVIVNPWTRNIIPWWLLLPQGVSGAIKKRGGTAPFKELAKHGSMPLGSAVLTSAGKLSFKAIVHVAGINMFWRASERSIRDSVRNAMSVVNEPPVRRVRQAYSHLASRRPLEGQQLQPCIA